MYIYIYIYSRQFTGNPETVVPVSFIGKHLLIYLLLIEVSSKAQFPCRQPVNDTLHSSIYPAVGSAGNLNQSLKHGLEVSLSRSFEMAVVVIMY